MRRVVIAVLLTIALLTTVTAGIGFVYSIGTACQLQKKQYNTLRAVIVKQNAITPASPIILHAFPEFKPFFTPGTPQYREAERLANIKRDAALSQLGNPPHC